MAKRLAGHSSEAEPISQKGQPPEQRQRASPISQNDSEIFRSVRAVTVR
jgi:hypothetical protein